MKDESLPPNKELIDFLHDSFSIDPYNLSGDQDLIIEKYKPELSEDYDLSSLGYLVDALIFESMNMLSWDNLKTEIIPKNWDSILHII